MKILLVVLLAVAAATLGAPRAHADDTAGLVDIGGGRSLYLNCQGEGSPTVFVIPGKGSYAEAWNAAVPPDDPIRSSPYDLIEEAQLGARVRSRRSRWWRRRPGSAPTTGPTPGRTAPTARRRSRSRTPCSPTSTTW